MSWDRRQKWAVRHSSFVAIVLRDAIWDFLASPMLFGLEKICSKPVKADSCWGVSVNLSGSAIQLPVKESLSESLKLCWQNGIHPLVLWETDSVNVTWVHVKTHDPQLPVICGT